MVGADFRPFLVKLGFVDLGDGIFPKELNVGMGDAQVPIIDNDIRVCEDNGIEVEVGLDRGRNKGFLGQDLGAFLDIFWAKDPRIVLEVGQDGNTEKHRG